MHCLTGVGGGKRTKLRTNLCGEGRMTKHHHGEHVPAARLLWMGWRAAKRSTRPASCTTHPLRALVLRPSGFPIPIPTSPPPLSSRPLLCPFATLTHPRPWFRFRTAAPRIYEMGDDSYTIAGGDKFDGVPEIAKPGTS